MDRGRLWALVRAAGAVLIAAAVIAQLRLTVSITLDEGRDLATTVVNFFSFFTILSNVASVVVLALAAIWGFRAASHDREPPRLGVALACVSTYMIITGIVYNLLLRQIELPQGATVGWSNEILHVIGPLILLLDVVLAPGRRRLPWRAIGTVVAVPLVWVVYTMIRGELVTNPANGDGWWYPYPFLSPHNPDLVPAGYPGVAVYVIGIALAFGLVSTAVVAMSRRRDAGTRVADHAAD